LPDDGHTPVSLLKNSATIGGLTLVSRVLGLVREMMSAAFLGAGMENDAFQVAFRLPNLFRALFAEGAFASAFVPMFNRKMAEADAEGHDGLQAAVVFAGQVLSVLFPFLFAFTLLMMLFAAQIVTAMGGASPQGGAATIDLAIVLTRITFPYLALISLVSLLGGILNSINRFWVNAAAPVLLNLCLISGLLFFRGATKLETAHTQAIAVTVSGVAQLAWLMWSCQRAGVVLKLRLPRLTPEVKTMLLLIFPAAVGAGAVQINQFISSTLALRFLPEGSISHLNYADRLYQLPLGLIGIGVGTAILPSLSRQIRSGKPDVAQHTQNRAIELALMLAIPAAVAMVVSAVPIIRGVFQRGAFGPLDTPISASALSGYCFGVPAYVLIKVLTPGFYARQDTRTPVRIAVFSMLVNLVGNLILIWPLQIFGIAISTAIAAWINVGLLYYTLHKRGHFNVDAQLRRSIAQIVAASVVMGGALSFLNPIVDPHLAGNLVERGVWLGVLIGGGAAAYLVCGLLLGAGAGRNFLRRKDS
jgi:putative peptidoglycan lipid II flippase